MLLNISAVDLFINKSFSFSFESSVLKTKSIKENPVETKNIIKINIPLAESVANECTLVKIPDLTKKVPKRVLMDSDHICDINAGGQFAICFKKFREFNPDVEKANSELEKEHKSAVESLNQTNLNVIIFIVIVILIF